MFKLLFLSFIIMFCVKMAAQTIALDSLQRDSLIYNKANRAFAEKKYRHVYKYFKQCPFETLQSSENILKYYISALKSGYAVEADELYQGLTDDQQQSVEYNQFPFVKSIVYASSHSQNTNRVSASALLQSNIDKIVSTWDKNNDLALDGLVFKTSDSYSLSSYHNVDKKIAMFNSFSYQSLFYNKSDVAFKQGEYQLFNTTLETSFFQYYVAFDFYITFNWHINLSIHSAEENISGYFFDSEKGNFMKQSHYLGQAGYRFGIKYRSYNWEALPSVGYFESETSTSYQLGSEFRWFFSGRSTTYLSTSLFVVDKNPYLQVQMSTLLGNMQLQGIYSRGEHNYLWRNSGLAINNGLMNVNETIQLGVGVPLIKNRFKLKINVAHFSLKPQDISYYTNMPIMPKLEIENSSRSNSVLNINTSISYTF